MISTDRDLGRCGKGVVAEKKRFPTSFPSGATIISARLSLGVSGGELLDTLTCKMQILGHGI